jgi:hypothetical protein
MNVDLIKAAMELQGMKADARHIEAAASTLTAVLKATAEPFSKLPLEAEPSAFPLEQRRLAP